MKVFLLLLLMLLLLSCGSRKHTATSSSEQISREVAATRYDGTMVDTSHTRFTHMEELEVTYLALPDSVAQQRGLFPVDGGKHPPNLFPVRIKRTTFSNNIRTGGLSIRYAQRDTSAVMVQELNATTSLKKEPSLGRVMVFASLTIIAILALLIWIKRQSPSNHL